MSPLVQMLISALNKHVITGVPYANTDWGGAPLITSAYQICLQSSLHVMNITELLMPAYQNAETCGLCNKTLVLVTLQDCEKISFTKI
jgi:hypothetical protein